MLNAAFTVASRSEPPCGWTIRRVTLRPQRRPSGSARPLFEPPTDVYETADSIVVRMEIAGLTPEQLEVALSNDGSRLTVAGNRPNPAAGKPRKYYTMEIECGDFSRQVPIPQPVDAEAVSASYSEGFLEVVLPKRAPAPRARRKVPIQ
jgi:HSP20 family protein